jgi:hypothetical protein
VQPELSRSLHHLSIQNFELHCTALSGRAEHKLIRIIFNWNLNKKKNVAQSCSHCRRQWSGKKFSSQSLVEGEKRKKKSQKGESEEFTRRKTVYRFSSMDSWHFSLFGWYENRCTSIIRHGESWKAAKVEYYIIKGASCDGKQNSFCRSTTIRKMIANFSSRNVFILDCAGHNCWVGASSLALERCINTFNVQINFDKTLRDGLMGNL